MQAHVDQTLSEMVKKHSWRLRIYSKIKVCTSDFCALTQDIPLSFFQFLIYFHYLKLNKYDVWPSSTLYIFFCVCQTLPGDPTFNKRLNLHWEVPALLTGFNKIRLSFPTSFDCCLHNVYGWISLSTGPPKSQKACLKLPVPTSFQLLQTV